jgi:hypothetical protein
MEMENGLNFMIQRIKIELRKKCESNSKFGQIESYIFWYEISCWDSHCRIFTLLNILVPISIFRRPGEKYICRAICLLRDLKRVASHLGICVLVGGSRQCSMCAGLGLFTEGNLTRFWKLRNSFVYEICISMGSYDPQGRLVERNLWLVANCGGVRLPFCDADVS